MCVHASNALEFDRDVDIRVRRIVVWADRMPAHAPQCMN